MKTKCKLAVLIAAITLTSGPTAPAQLIQPGATQQNHADWAQSAFFNGVRDSVCQVVASFPDGSSKSFNGFYFSYNDRVGIGTVAHGLRLTDSGGQGISSIQLRFGPDVSNPALTVECSSWLANPLFGGATGDPNDSGLIVPANWNSLSGVAPIALYTGQLSVGDILYTIGYGPFGYPGSGSWTPSSIQSAFANRISNFGYFSFPTNNAVTLFDMASWSEFVDYEGIPLPTWSGSLSLVENNGRLEAGLFSEFISNGNSPTYGTRAGFLPISSQLDFLLPNMQPIPEPRALALLLLAGILLMFQRCQK